MPHPLPVRLVFLASSLLCLVASSSAQSLKIISTPPGAKVELDGVAAGTTPFEKNFPGGYFHDRNHGQYWLFKSDHFEVNLDPVGATFTGASPRL